MTAVIFSRIYLQVCGITEREASSPVLRMVVSSQPLFFWTGTSGGTLLGGPVPRVVKAHIIWPWLGSDWCLCLHSCQRFLEVHSFTRLAWSQGHGRGVGLKSHYSNNLNKQTPDLVYHWEKLEVDLTSKVLSQLQDLGLNCIPLVPQCSLCYSKFE